MLGSGHHDCMSGGTRACDGGNGGSGSPIAMRKLGRVRCCEGYLVLLQVKETGPATLVLVQAAMPKQPSYSFEIVDPKVGGNGVVDLVGSDQSPGTAV